MKRFSERMGITKPPEIQLGCMNQALQNSLWNLVLEYLDHLREIDRQEEKRYYSRSIRGPLHRYRKNFIKDVARSFFKVAVDDLPPNEDVAQQWLKNKFGGLEWYRVYDFIEFLIHKEGVFKVEELNSILEGENSAYRWVDNKFAPLTNEQEIKEIEEAIERADKVGIDGAREHLSSALSLLARKPEPDYRNSIKESISAVESVVKQISGESGGGLDKALKELSKTTEIHGSLEQGFIRLYGYTSDAGGIRHAMLEKPNVGFDEAKFMLVSCSAFTNYLISKAQKAGLLKEG